MLLEQGFSLTLPRAVLFGWGRFSEAPDRIMQLGGRIYLITGKKSPAAERARSELVRELEKHGAQVRIGPSPAGEPTVQEVDQAVREAAAWRPEVVVGCGGGSVLDTAKAVAALLPNAEGRSAARFLEGTGNPEPLRRDPLPCVAIPTTAGTGTEATRNAVLSWPEMGLKRSLRDHRMVPVLAVVDPELTVTTPVSITAFSGMDAITQLIESFVSRRAVPPTDALCRSAVPLALKALPVCIENPQDREARAGMAYAALVSGICLANAGLGVAHAVAPALGILFGVPHGKACAVLLPFALEVNREAAQAKLAELARLCGSTETDDRKAADRFIGWIKELCRKLGIPQNLRSLGVTEEALERVAALSSTNSLRGNARPLTKEELPELLKKIL